MCLFFKRTLHHRERIIQLVNLHRSTFCSLNPAKIPPAQLLSLNRQLPDGVADALGKDIPGHDHNQHRDQCDQDDKTGHARGFIIDRRGGLVDPGVDLLFNLADRLGELVNIRGCTDTQCHPISCLCIRTDIVAVLLPEHPVSILPRIIPA